MEKLQGEIGEVLKQSLNIKKAINDCNDCVKFEFDVKVFKVKGEFCESGIIDFKIYIAGVQTKHAKINLSKGEYCIKANASAVNVKCCFHLKKGSKGSCLYTKGYIDSWLFSKKSWNEKITCIW